MQVYAHSRPADVAASQLAGRTVVVIDVLRATTTMIWALAAGAERILPVATIEEAFAAKKPGWLLGGERGGQRIEGFDRGNSPAEYAGSDVTGATIVMTTTNGTRALWHAQQADRIWVAAFANLTHCVEQLARTDDRQLHILCAGTDGHPTEEDTLVAGAIIGRLADDSSAVVAANETAHEALAKWQACDLQGLTEAMRQSRGGRNLIAIGFDDDIRRAALIDRSPILPRFDPKTGDVTVAT